MNSELLRYAVCKEHVSVAHALHHVLREFPLDQAEVPVKTLLDIEDPAKLSETLNASFKGSGMPTLLHALSFAKGDVATHEKMLRMLLAAGLSGHKKDNPLACSPLQNYAAKEGGAPLIRLLVQHGANVNEATEHGATPLWEAAAHNCIENFNVLRELGADISSCDSLKLHHISLPMAFALLDARGSVGEAAVPDAGLSALFGQHREVLSILRASSSSRAAKPTPSCS